MEYGMDKCTALVLKKGKIKKFNGIWLPDGRFMKGLIEWAAYKYLGIVQAQQTRYTEMNEMMKPKYLRRVRKVLKTKLNGVNIISNIHMGSISSEVLGSIDRLELCRIDKARCKN